jgi:hypothetical protein
MSSVVMFLCSLVSGVECRYSEPPFLERTCVFMDGRTITGGRELVCPPEASTITIGKTRFPLPKEGADE